MVPMQIWDVLSTIGAPFSPHSSHVACRPKCASQLPTAPAAPRSHRDQKAADRTFGEAEWVGQGDWDFICWTCWTPRPPKENLVFFLGGFFWDVVLFFICFFLQSSPGIGYDGFFCQTKMGLALLNMDFTEQMGICGVLDLEGDLLGKARFT